MIDFPDSPVLDEIFTTPKVDFKWLGDRWKREGGTPPVLIPTLTLLVPDSGEINDASISVSCQGTNFTAASVVMFDGVAVATTFVSDVELTVIAPSKTATGTAQVTVEDNGQISNALTFTYIYTPPPVVLPVLTSLSPDRMAHGTGYGFTIRYLGSGFDPTCVAYYDGAPAPSTTYISTTEIQANGIDSPPMSAETVSKNCFVRNSVGDSATLPFRYYNSSLGIANITFINPGSVSWHNSANLEIEVTGTDFSNDAIVMMGPHPMVTRYVAQNMVRFDVIPTNYSTGQDHEWTVTVDQANGVSNGFPFFFIF